MAGARQPDIEQRVRLLEGKMCSILNNKTGTGIDMIPLTGIDGLDYIYDARLVNVKLVYLDRQGLGLSLLSPQSPDIPSTRQAKHSPETGYIYFDPLNPITSDESFTAVFTFGITK